LVPQYAANLAGGWVDICDGIPFAGSEIQVLHNGDQTRVRIPMAANTPGLFARAVLRN